MRPVSNAQVPLMHGQRWSSPLDAARTFGLTDDRFYKIVEARGVGARRRQDLRGEFDLLRRCRGLAGIPGGARVDRGRRQADPRPRESARTAAQPGRAALAEIRPGAAAPAPSGLGPGAARRVPQRPAAREHHGRAGLPHSARRLRSGEHRRLARVSGRGARPPGRRAPVCNGVLAPSESASRRGFRPGSFGRCVGDDPARRP